MPNHRSDWAVTKVGACAFLLGVFSHVVQAQDEASLRAAFEGTKVTVKIDMPGTADGVNVFTSDRLPLDFQRYRNDKHQ